MQTNEESYDYYFSLIFVVWCHPWKNI